MTVEAGSSVFLAELQVALFRECNNQRLSHGVGHSPILRILLQICVKTSIMISLLEQVLLVYYQLRQTSSFSLTLLQSQLPHGGSVADLLPGADCSPVLRCL